MNAGLRRIAALITPFEKERKMIRDKVREESCLGDFTDCALEVGEKRDVKCLQGKARKGLIENFIGTNSS